MSVMDITPRPGEIVTSLAGLTAAQVLQLAGLQGVRGKLISTRKSVKGPRELRSYMIVIERPGIPATRCEFKVLAYAHEHPTDPSGR